MDSAENENTTTQRRERFEALIEKAEAHLKNDPQGYRRKLAFLAGLGYVYLFGVMFLFIALIGGSILGAFYSSFFLYLLISKKAGILLIMVLYGLTRALWVRFDPPTGYEIKTEQAPELFADIESIRKQLDAPRIHEVLLTQEYNASIQQTPRLGVFGCNKNTLILGLPLLMSLNKESFRAVIGHELGHLARNHSRFAGWIYRVRTSWHKIQDSFENGGMFSDVVFGKFFAWYAPYFDAYSFAFARANEYQADTMAARITTNKTVAQTLAQVRIHAHLLEDKYWENVTEQCDASANVNAKVFTALNDYIRSQPFSKEEKLHCLKEQLELKTDHEDTHPALKDRLKPLVKKIGLPDVSSPSAAQLYLGENLVLLLQEFDRQWAKENELAWKERYEFMAEGKEALRELEEKHKAGKMSSDDLWNLAAWTEKLKPKMDPLPLYRMAWMRNRKDPQAAYALGRLLLERKDASGIGFLDTVIKNHPRLTIPACELAWEYFNSKGDAATAQKYRLRAEEHIDLEDRAEAERRDLISSDEYLEHGLAQESLESLREQLQKFDKIKHAWICRKKVALFPDEPIYVVILQKKGWFTREEKLREAVIENLEMQDEYFLICKNGENRSLAKKALKTASPIC